MKTRLLLILLSCFLFLFINTKAAETEPNNTPAQANVLPLNGSNSGSITTGSDVDWYKITTTGDGAIALTLTVSNGQYARFDLYDTLGVIQLHSDYTNSTFAYSVDGLAKGTYYVKVYSYDGSYTPDYTISNTLTVPTQANDHEPDSTPAQANTLPLNGSITGHINYYFNNHKDSVDWYKLTTNADGAINLQLDVANGNYVRFELYDGDGVTQLHSDYTSSSFNYTVDGLAKGVYYVRIIPYGDSYFAPYTLTNTLIAAAYTNDNEPDSTPAQAITLTLNDSTTGHIDYYYNHHKDSVDWYKFTTNSDGAINLQLDVANGNYVRFELYDGDGVTLLRTDYTSTSYNYTVDGLAQGVYYIKIYPYGDGYFAPYKIHNTLIKPAYTNDNEPDSIPAQAITLALNDSTTGYIGYYYNHHKDSVDWYKFTTNADGAINLQLDVANSNYVRFDLYDGDGATLLHSDYTSTSYNYTVDGLAQGVYYIRIYPYSDGYFAPYKIHNTLITIPQANDNEPDSTPTLAATLPLNSSVTGHINYYYNHHKDSVDWYKLTLPTNGAVNLQLDVANNQYVRFEVYAKDGVTQLHSDYTSSSYNYTVDGLGKDVYYVKIIPYSDGYFAPYTLKDTFYMYNPADTVPNDHFAQAPTIPVNRTVTGDVGFYFYPIRDTADYWKINYTGTGNMTLTLGLTPPVSSGIHYTYFQVYQDTTAAPIFSDYTSGSTYQKDFTGLSQGYYYVKVFELSSGDFNPYSLTLAFTQVNIATIAIKSTRPSLDSCGGNSITYNLGGSHSPYGVQLYRNGVRYDSVNVVSDTARFDHLPTGIYYATVYGDGATDYAYGTSGNTAFLPPTPKGLTTTNILVHTAKLNWTTYSCVKSYRVQYRLSTASTWTTLDDPNDAIGTYTLTGLTMYTNYTWRVASVDTAQANTLVGAYSDTASFKTLSDTAIITLVKAAQGKTCSSDTLKYVSTHSVAPYTVQLYRNGAVYGSPVSSTDSTIFTGLLAGIYYATSSGTGSGGSFGTSAIDTLLPPAPMGLTTNGITVHTAALNWTPLTCEHNYIIEYHPSGVTAWIMINAFANTSGTYTLTGLSPYTSYEWRIASVDSLQGSQFISPYSDSLMFTTLSDTAHIVKGSKTQGTTCSSSTLVYNLSNSTAPYTVQLYNYGSVYGSAVQATGTATFSSLPSGVYYATATGTGSGGSLGSSGVDTITPPVPTGLDTGMVTTTSAQLNWTPLSCVKYFTLQYKLLNASTWTTLSTSGNVSADTLSNLLPDTMYVWRIASVDSANGYVLNSDYSVTDTFQTKSVLPVTLLSFKAAPVNNTVQVSWQTANETNSKSFTVLRSSDGITFLPIGTVSAFGNTSLQHQYSFVDNSPLNGTSYYRLRQMDNDGRFTDSKTATVVFSGNLLFTLYPNPAIDVVHVNFSSVSAATLVVYDANGKAVLQKIIGSGAGSQTLNVSSLAAGIYTVVLHQNNQQQSLRFVKR